MSGNKSTEKFIEKAKRVHGDKYDYSKVEYVNATTKVRIICPIHGEFLQMPPVHLRGCNCPSCSIETIKHKNTKGNEKFIEKARIVHGDKYDYSKVEYVNNKTNVCIICPIHGEFYQTPQVHLRGGECKKCSHKEKTKTLEQFIKEAKEVHGGKYDYSKVEYVNAHTNVVVICKKHGEFMVRPCNHLHGNGCPICKKEKIGNYKRKTLEDFVDKANDIHNNKYIYSATTYSGRDYKVTVTCPIHGDFAQIAGDHLNGHGCPKCANQQSLAEDEIFNHITSLIGDDKVIRRDKSILDDKRELDIYIPHLKIGIEYNGLYWHTEEYGKDRFYHLKKIEDFNSKGIRVIQIFEDEWNENKKLVLNKIDHILGLQANLPRIMARKCEVREISKLEAEAFLSKNHIQGYIPSTLYIGAFYNDTLVGVTSFTEEKKELWNLTRMSTDINFVCNGICGKMLSFFKEHYKWKTIKTFADRRWTLNENGNLYTKLGFELTDVLKPDYRYVVGKKRVHKFNFRKQTLHNKYGFDLSMKEDEMIKKLKIQKIWDCGLFKYQMENECQ